MEGVSSSCMIGYGDNSNSNGNGNGNVVTTPMMMMMMPLVSSSNHHGHDHHHHHSHHHGHGNNNPSAETGNNPLIMSPLFLPPATHHSSHSHHQNLNINHTSGGYFKMVDDNTNDATTTDSDSSISSFKAKIMAHPYYHRLLASYLSCQKVGAPPEVVARMEAACRSAAAATGHVSRGCLGEDPALDQFMEAYSEMLCKYALEISKPFNEAMLFLQRIDSQFKSLTVSSSDPGCGERNNGSSEEDMVVNNGLQIDPLAEDRELKGQLLRRYSGYIGSLKQEFMKKRKKGKLPKEARQQLLDWWGCNYKWPYPSEAQKLALADSTGLDQKQINNWFINQRKRHWKTSEDVQFVVMDGSHPHQYYMDNFLGNPFPMDIAPTML